MQRTREFITAGLAIRKAEGIKVRQPLASVTLPAVQKLPLQLLLDIPVVASTGGAGVNTGVQTKALRHALELLGLKPVSHHAKARHHARSHSGSHSRSRSHGARSHARRA